jgi:hypothetical protein
MRLFSLLWIAFFTAIILSGSSCRKSADVLNPGRALRFSADTLLFDTVFVSAGSATYKIKIYNELNKTVTLNSVRLEKGSSSFFRLNVNGISGQNVANQELAPHDSLYVYSTVKIDPNSALSPFIVDDRLIATVNGSDYAVPVIAYGQNARYIFDSVLQTQTWDNVLPYVIVNNALVDKDQTLTIDAGCRIYVHPNSRLYVEGTLLVNGTKNDSVVFQTDRIDRSYFGYKGYPGEWGGLYFTENSKGSKLKWTVIKDCGNSTALGQSVTQPAAVQVDNNTSLGSASEGVHLENCIIQNSIGYGLLSFGGKVSMLNTMINTCGSQNVGIFQGGNFDFTQCTFVTYGTRLVSHVDAPVMSLLNYLDTSQTGYIPGNLKAVLRNCIIYGSLEDELVCNDKGPGQFDITLDHCLIKAKAANPKVVFSACKFNEDPKFEDIETWNYRLKEGSPARNAGIAPFFGSNLDDISGNQNIGAY